MSTDQVSIQQNVYICSLLPVDYKSELRNMFSYGHTPTYIHTDTHAHATSTAKAARA